MVPGCAPHSDLNPTEEGIPGGPGVSSSVELDRECPNISCWILDLKLGKLRFSFQGFGFRCSV